MGLDDAAADEMLLDDALDRLGVGVAIPNAVGVYEQDRPALTDAQTVGLGAEDAGRAGVDRAIELKFFEASLEIVPGNDTVFLRAALRLGCVGADKDVLIDAVDREAADALGEATVDCGGQIVDLRGAIVGGSRGGGAIVGHGGTVGTSSNGKNSVGDRGSNARSGGQTRRCAEAAPKRAKTVREPVQLRKLHRVNGLR